MSDEDAAWHHAQAQEAKRRLLDFWMMDEPDDDAPRERPRERREKKAPRYLPDYCADCVEDKRR